MSSDKRIRRLAIDALLLAIAMILSYVETVFLRIPLPLPGFKLGLANAAVVLAVFYIGIPHGAAVLYGRVLLSFLLFGSPTSLLFSLIGGTLSLLTLSLLKNRTKGLSYVGISVLSASAHNCGQLIAAVILMGPAPLSYAPVLCLASAVCGTLSGLVLNLIPEKIFKLGEK